MGSEMCIRDRDYITELGGSSLVSNMDESENDDDDQSEGVDVTDDAFPEALVDESGNVEDLDLSILGVASFSADSLNQYCLPVSKSQRSSQIQEHPDPASSSLLDAAGGTSLSTKGEHRCTTPVDERASIADRPNPTGPSVDKQVRTTPLDGCGTDDSSKANGPAEEGERKNTPGSGKVMHPHAQNNVQSLSLTSSSEGNDAKKKRPSKGNTWMYTRAADYSVFTLAEAWEHGNIARKQKSLGDNCDYKFLSPTLTCEHCCHPHGCFCLYVGEDRYLEAITNSINWYDGIFISSFAQLAAHYAHSTAALPDPTMMAIVTQMSTTVNDQCDKKVYCIA